MLKKSQKKENIIKCVGCGEMVPSKTIKQCKNCGKNLCESCRHDSKLCWDCYEKVVEKEEE